MATGTADFIKGAVKHPGRLSGAAKKNGKSTLEQAKAWAGSGSASEQEAANLYLHALRRGAPKGKNAKKAASDNDADD